MGEIGRLPAVLYKMLSIADWLQAVALDWGDRGSIPSCARIAIILVQDKWCNLVRRRSASIGGFVPEDGQDMDCLVPGSGYSWYKTGKINNPLAAATASPRLFAGIGDRGLECCQLTCLPVQRGFRSHASPSRCLPFISASPTAAP